ncbi:MAG: bifunctional (p)ppGpp synthetase/guanosine-3',5'-bis(diphosphate) 3'-pyrophosphohydrolase [Bacteroidales bacterium]|nr:bifunctional (p)ppGpp synthetase/guanosine-3',5'-bis(diphosphate) 3'-pyrophosphohydrolase [Bacteroidales bacterium]
MEQSAAEQERQEILRRYRNLIEVWTTRKTTKDLWDVRRAFRMAADAHKDMRRKSGEPFILHPLAVATIAAQEIGLGRTSIISALLHDTVEDTDVTLEDVEKMFGEKVSRIIDGLTKIDEISDNNSTAQSATLKKVILTLSDDVRVILVKLADRLHNMRTMDIMPREKQLRIASETLFIYAPLAYKLGLYSMKSELEDLSFKYSQSEIYEEITYKMGDIREERNLFLKTFGVPITNNLNEKGINAELLVNERKAYSVWKKMQRTELPFEQIYNSYSLDIVVDTEGKDESLQCWAVYSTVAALYKPNNKRLRDWMNTPKANGYEAIHTTVMGPGGRWVDVHIRSKRMQEIAQKGYAAYLKYKTNKSEIGSLEVWLQKTKELLVESDGDESISFISDFKQELFSDEIYVFTPAGEMINLPKDATVLDFAYSIHTDLGNHAIGANVNRRLVSIDHPLRSGDQVEVITSKIQEPVEDWYQTVVTARAKARIKTALKNKRKSYREKGEEKLKEMFHQLNLEYQPTLVQKLMKSTKLTGQIDFYYQIATEKIGFEEIKKALHIKEERTGWSKLKNLSFPFSSKSPKKETKKKNKKLPEIPIIENSEQTDYFISKCCHPVPGDDVLALQIDDGPIQIHRTDCDEAIKLMSVFGRNIVKGKWKQQEGIAYLAGLKITSKDRLGLLNEVTDLIFSKYKLSINNIHLSTNEGLVQMEIKLFVDNTMTLKKLISELSKFQDIIKVDRTTRI